MPANKPLSPEHRAKISAGQLAKVPPEVRRLRGQIGAFKQWSRETDPTGRTATARECFQQRTPDSPIGRFELQVDPELQLDPETRARMAEQARREYFTRLALASARARARKSRPA
jgi:hypothetical protein